MSAIAHPDVAVGRDKVRQFDLEELSKSGLRINCPTAVPSDSRGELKVQGSAILGTVRYARSVGYEFHVGIEAEVLQTTIDTTRGKELDLTSLLPIDALRLRRA